MSDELPIKKLVWLVPCQHVVDETFCDVHCDAYVRGDGLIEVLVTEQLLSRAEWEATIAPCPGDDPTCPGHDHGDPCHYREKDA